MGIWELCESRLVQERSNASAANADSLLCGYPGVPDGKLWIVLACGYMPDVAETQVVTFQKISSKSGSVFSLLNPSSMALNPARATFIEQGMEYLLLPGEYLQVRRGNHTAGSTMSVWMQLVEIDQPLYTYDEPQAVKIQKRAISSIRQQLGGGSGRGSVGPISRPEGGGGGGGRRGEPI